MSYIDENGAVVICVQEDEECELCGAFEECRPYGPNGENICYTCGMKDEETTRKMLRKVLLGVTEQ